MASSEISLVKTDGLTPQQQRFVAEFTAGKTAGNLTNSAKAAGYSHKAAPSIACSLAKLPHVALAIDAALREAIGTTLTVQAVACIRSIINDTNAPLKLRGEMSARVLEFSGIVERTKLEAARKTGIDGRSAGDKRLVDMTRSELEALVRNGAAVMSAAAGLPSGPVIEGSAQDSAQAAPIAAE
jgi:phage terminase small subunit